MNLGGCHGNYNVMGVQNSLNFMLSLDFGGTYVLSINWVDFY